MSQVPHEHLPRLDHAHYRGLAIVHWVHTTADRKTGWLDDVLHAGFREVLLHAAVRYELLCSVYCLMPDHMHILWMGAAMTSDQQNACAFLRRHMNTLLRPRGVTLQKQAYDHVLREQERERNAFERTAWYVMENPVRAGLVKDRTEWPYCGCVVPGFPDWEVRDEAYWPRFWREYERRRRSHVVTDAAT